MTREAISSPSVTLSVRGGRAERARWLEVRARELVNLYKEAEAFEEDDEAGDVTGDPDAEKREEEADPDANQDEPTAVEEDVPVA